MTYFQITLLIGLAVFVGLCWLFYCDAKKGRWRSRLWHVTSGRISVIRDAHIHAPLEVISYCASRQTGGIFSHSDFELGITWHKYPQFRDIHFSGEREVKGMKFK